MIEEQLLFILESNKDSNYEQIVVCIDPARKLYHQLNALPKMNQDYLVVAILYRLGDEFKAESARSFISSSYEYTVWCVVNSFVFKNFNVRYYEVESI